MELPLYICYFDSELCIESAQLSSSLLEKGNLEEFFVFFSFE